jgi:AcrR family transcriptional regulator
MVQQRLLEIAIREFGAKGLEGASTRGIAAAAGTAMSSITYHYGGKEGLYLAAADYIAEQMSEGIELGDRVTENDPAAARIEIVRILHVLIDKLTYRRNESWSLFIVREQMNPTEAFERIYAGPMGRMMKTLIDQVGTATGLPDGEAVRLAVITLFGQVLVIRAARGACARILERKLDDPDLLRDLKARVAANTNAILDRLIAEQEERP